MAEPLLDYLTPASLGLDSKKFPSFREVQLEAIEKVCYSDKPVVGLCAATGTGKELIALGIARYSAKKTMILTHTKGLQDQYKSNHQKFGLADIRGQQNYQCLGLNWQGEGATCKDGADEGCRFKGGKGCSYEVAKGLVEQADVSCGNYAYWLAVNQFGSFGSGVKVEVDPFAEDEQQPTGGSAFEQLILDEGHFAVEAVSSFLGFRLYEKELTRYLDPLTMGDKVEQWVAVAKLIIEDIRAEVRTLKVEQARKATAKVRDAIKHLKGLYDRVYKLMGATSDDWICEQQVGGRYGRSWSFDVVWPGKYVRSRLFCGVEKVVVMSATLRPKTMSQLGLSKDEYEFFEWPRVFQASRNPVYYYPPMLNDKPVRVVRSTADEGLKAWVERVDEIIGSRLDRRMLVITTSYAYQQFIMERSKFAHLMIGNTTDPDSDTAQESFERFVKHPIPTVLCSPSFGTGWDFKGDRCEVLIISKLPLRPPANASKLIAARLEQDKEYCNYGTMQDMVQFAGRGMRAEWDRCEVFVVDGSWEWFGMRNKHLAPRGFVQGVRRVNRMPTKPEKLKANGER